MNTLIAEAPASKTHLGVGFDSNRGQTQNRDAWKRSIGTKQVPARLAMLPEGDSRWQRVGISAVAQIIVAFLFGAAAVLSGKIEDGVEHAGCAVVDASYGNSGGTSASATTEGEKVAPAPKPVVIEESS